MQRLAAQMRQQVAAQIRRVVIGVVGGLLIALGGGFLVAALYIAILPVLGPLGACLVLGAVFTGLGLVLIALRGGASSKPARTNIPPPPPPRGDLPPLLDAFLLGVSVYLRSRRPRK